MCVPQINRTTVMIAIPASSPAPRSLLEVLPTSTFLVTVFPFLDFRTVGQLLTVSRVWQDLLTHELAWKCLCDQLRQDLVYVAPSPTPLRTCRETFLQSFRFFPVWNPHRAASAAGVDSSDLLPLQTKSSSRGKDQGKRKDHAKVQDNMPFSIQVLVRFRPRGAVLPEPPVSVSVATPAEKAASAKGDEEVVAAAASDDDKENGPARTATNAGTRVLRWQFNTAHNSGGDCV
jgi:hypothetical protein